MAKNFLIWLVVLGVLLLFINNLTPNTATQEMSYNDFISQVEQGQIKQVDVAGRDLTVSDGSGKTYHVMSSYSQEGLEKTLLENDVEINYAEPESQSIFTQLLVASFPIIIIILVFLFFMRQMQGGGGKGGPMSFGKSKAKLLSEDQIKTTFADVAGVDEAKDDVEELVDFLQDPGKYQRLGGKIPRGVLMVGQPGTGKTLLAKAIAGEAKVPFFSISGSDFVEMFVGVGASRVRDMFEQAKKQAPCIIFIDEIDAVGRSRGVGMGGGNDEREQTLNQLLVEMDGFEANDGVIVIAATNRPDVLDPALRRPGRFDREVVVSLPDVRGREQILEVYLKKAPISDDVEASLIARGTPGFSGADLANLVNEAALFAARLNKRIISMDEMEKAKDKILMGAEKKAMVMSEEELINTAYHEAGHAIVGLTVPSHDPVYKVSIIPRGRALGVTMYLPEQDKYSLSKEEIESRICSLYGGRIAEEMTLGKSGVTTGASDDIRRASEYARNMVMKWGLSDELGPLLYEKEQQGYLGSDSERVQMSQMTSKLIDETVRKISDECYKRAFVILEEHRSELEAMKDALMEYETIDASQIKEIMEGNTPTAPKDWHVSKKKNKLASSIGEVNTKVEEDTAEVVEVDEENKD
jgi:cell division protease FtsH